MVLPALSVVHSPSESVAASSSDAGASMRSTSRARSASAAARAAFSISSTPLVLCRRPFWCLFCQLHRCSFWAFCFFALTALQCFFGRSSARSLRWRERERVCSCGLCSEASGNVGFAARAATLRVMSNLDTRRGGRTLRFWPSLAASGAVKTLGKLGNSSTVALIYRAAHPNARARPRPASKTPTTRCQRWPPGTSFSTTTAASSSSSCVMARASRTSHARTSASTRG